MEHTINIYTDTILKCTDFLVIRSVLTDSFIGPEFFGKPKDLVIDELDDIRNHINEQMTSNTYLFEDDSFRAKAEVIYHRLSAYAEQEIENFSIKYPQIPELIKYRLSDVELELRELFKKYKFLETYKNRRNIILDDKVCEENHWSPYLKVFNKIWDDSKSGRSDYRSKRILDLNSCDDVEYKKSKCIE